MKIYRAVNMVSGVVHEGTGDELAVILDRSKTTVRTVAVVGGVIDGTWRMQELGECADFPDHAERLGLSRVCPGCGKKFVAKRFLQEWCGDTCARGSYKKAHPEKFRIPGKPKADPKPVVKKPELSTVEIDRMARAEKLSYGVYVAAMEYPVKIVRKWV